MSREKPGTTVVIVLHWGMKPYTTVSVIKLEPQRDLEQQVEGERKLGKHKICIPWPSNKTKIKKDLVEISGLYLITHTHNTHVNRHI